MNKVNWIKRGQQHRLPQWLENMEVHERVKRQVTIAEQLFMNDDTQFATYMCKEDKRSYFRIAGKFPFQLKAEQSYIIEGKVALYKDTKQIVVDSVRVARPVTIDGIILLLQSLDGCNKRAFTLTEYYGVDAVEILSNDPLRVAREISGVSEKLAESWSKQLKWLGGNFDLLARLQGWGLSLNQAKKLISELGQETDAIIERNPYILAKRVRGYGFRKCDLIAQELGLDMQARTRMIAAISYVLREASYDGHCYVMRADLITKVKATLDMPKREGMNEQINIPPSVIEDLLEQLLLKQKLVEDAGRIYLRDLYEAELHVAAQILRIMLHPVTTFSNNRSEVQSYLRMKGIQLEKKQLEAVTTFSEQSGGMYILNGSAGCGKTFTLNIILDLLELQYKKNGIPFQVNVFAPTGKAAKVAAKATGRECTTIHRGLKYNPERGFEFNAKNHLLIDCLVLDESSMLDIKLAKHLFQAIPPHCKVILMGDTKQLPSIGAGNVLHDLISSEVIPVVTLDVVKRQAKDSGIVANATRIIEGQNLENQAATGDAFIISGQNAKITQAMLLKSISRLISSKGYSLEDIQVLCPQRKGEAGTYVMNWLIQQTFNPYEGEMKVENCKFTKVIDDSDETEQITLYFLPGDKVIHIANNYAMKWYEKDEKGQYCENRNLLGITNGECGVIEEIFTTSNLSDQGEEIVVVVRYEEGYVMYKEGLDELDHCYAMTVHKSQGSQWPAVIMIVMQEHFHMLDNSIFYTGYTRAKQFVCVIGQQNAISNAISTFKHARRNSSLKERFMVTE